MIRQLGYFFWDVIDMLAIVEAPQTAVPVRPPWLSEKDQRDEAPQVQQQERAVTSSLRKTIEHLYRIGGATVVLRGAACYLCLKAATVALILPAIWSGLSTDPNQVKWDESVSSRVIPDLKATAAECVALLILSSWMTAWVHVVITQPTLRIWYRRLPPFLPTLRATWRPIVCAIFADFFVWKVIPRPIRYAAGMYVTGYKAPSGFITSDKIIRTLSWLLVHAANILINLPLNMVSVRIQASLLPEDEDTIVTFDRTFGLNGNHGLQPGLLAQPRGALSFKEAWRSITWAEMRRMILLHAKFVLVEAAISAVFWTMLGKDALPMQYIPWEYRH